MDEVNKHKRRKAGVRRHQTDSLLVVVVELPDGPRHDDGERYTCGGETEGYHSVLFIPLRHSDHEIPRRGFHAANMKSLFFFPGEAAGACQAPSSAPVAAGP